MNPALIGALIGVIGTLVAVFIGFFLDEIKSWILKPSLQVYYTHSSSHADAMLLPFLTKSGVYVTEYGWAYHFRLRIKNEGKTTAKSVEVFAASLVGDVDVKRKFIPMNLAWSHGTQLHPSEKRLMYFPSIAPGMEKHCDLGHINHHTQRHKFNSSRLGIDPTEVYFQFDLMTNPSSLSDIITKGEYLLTIVVAAMNAKPKEHKFKIWLSGKWCDNESDMFKLGIKIDLL